MRGTPQPRPAQPARLWAPTRSPSRFRRPTSPSCGCTPSSRSGPRSPLKPTRKAGRGFLESRLRLRVNREKSAVAPVGERKFLGYRLDAGGTLGIAPKSLQRSKARRRQITKRNRAVSLAQMIGEANTYLMFRGYTPSEITVGETYETVDTPENRFVKYFLEECFVLAQRLAQRLGDSGKLAL
jgi:hypothetical protein